MTNYTGIKLHSETGYENDLRRAIRINRGWPEYKLTIEVGTPEQSWLASYGKLSNADAGDEGKLSIALKDLLHMCMQLKPKAEAEA